MQSAVKCLQSVAFSQKMIVRLRLHHFFLAGNSGVVGFFALLVCFLQTAVGLNCSEIKNNAQKPTTKKHKSLKFLIFRDVNHGVVILCLPTLFFLFKISMSETFY